MLIGYFYEYNMPQSIILGASIFLSSTAVVLKCLSSEEAETGYGRAIIGMLVVQDVFLGLLLTTVPILSRPYNEIFYLLGTMFLSIILFLLITAVLFYPVRYFMRKLSDMKSSELLLMSVLNFNSSQ